MIKLRDYQLKALELIRNMSHTTIMLDSPRSGMSYVGLRRNVEIQRPCVLTPEVHALEIDFETAAHRYDTAMRSMVIKPKHSIHGSLYASVARQQFGTSPRLKLMVKILRNIYGERK